MADETIRVSGGQLIEKIKELLHKGNIRRVRIVHEGRALIDIPLTVGVPAAAATIIWAPILAAVGAIAGLITECTLEIEKVDDSDTKKD